MRKVLYSPAGKIHPVEYNLINYPPEGYEFTISKSKLDRLVKSSFIFDKVRLQLLDKLIPLNLVKSMIDSMSIPEDTELVYAYNHIVLGRPYIIHVEWAHILVGRDLKFLPFLKGCIKEQLESTNCKKILTWTNLAYDSLIDLYKVPHDKIKVIPPCVPSKDITRDYNKDSINLLFVGSANQSNDFEEKGGMVVLEVFTRLRKEYGERVSLTIKAKVPKIAKALEGVAIVDYFVTREELDSLYRNADIFFLPTLLFQNTAVIEAASYGLPIVTTSIGTAFEEYLQDEVNCLSRGSMSSELVSPILKTETTLRSKVIKKEVKEQKELTEAFYYDISRLIDNPKLREFLGTNAKKEVDTGRFSIENRNKKLKEIFDEAYTK